jgi:uncharacterized protein (TIGR02453 family)
MAFRGWPPDALDFYRELELDNSKSYWQANKARYEEGVKAPFEALMADLDEEFGPMRMFRPYRDVRFSKDKSPYKTSAAAVGEREGGASYYLHLSAAGLYVGSGYYHMAADQLVRFRDAVDDDRTGAELEKVCAAMTKNGQQLDAVDELKSAPKGYSKDHPRIGLLRRKGLHAGRSFEPAGWLHTAKAEERIIGTWRDAEPMNAWLDAHVGPSELPPDERPR